MTRLTTWVATHRKAVTGLVAGVLSWGTVVQNTGIDAHALWGLATVIAGAFGVSAMTNDDPPA